MNALAADQARRIARTIDRTPALRGRVTAGVFVGRDNQQRSAHKTMGRDHVVTDRDTLRERSPDILLTNYKMLDYLLVRPFDFRLWRHNGPDTLRYLVVDELHTFDGAQGTDLACLIRRLRVRLGASRDTLICAGTSATLGEEADEAELLAYVSRAPPTAWSRCSRGTAAGSASRRTAGGAPHQYLLLYDTVPSGTGYLKELMTEPGQLLSVFEEARAALKSCVCNQEPEKDGCYRCVFAYRRSREMAEISRDTAVEMLDRILAHKDELEEVPRTATGRGVHRRLRIPS